MAKISRQFLENTSEEIAAEPEVQGNISVVTSTPRARAASISSSQSSTPLMALALRWQI